jgi:hypothetical protein
MGFKRSIGEGRPSNEVLTARMVGIGMNFAATAEADADIETTLVHASALGMDDGDFRVLSVLTTWLGVHHTHVNADRLIRLVAGHDSIRVRAYWSGIAKWFVKDRRFARLISKQAKVDLLSVGTDFQLKRKGEDERFAGSTLRVPRETLRDRNDDVLPAVVLAKRHAGFRNRVVIGPTWRADVWTILEKAPQLSAAEAARRASCSFAAAWQATRDFRLLHPSP